MGDLPEATFASELLKLLVQVAWADGEVAPAEREALLNYARRSGVSESELASLNAALTGRAPPAAPNLGLLKQRRTDVLRAVKELLLSDLRLAEEEEDVLGQIADLLR
jgi:uncharacterized tellurite resistance protein B-like protein